MLRLQLDEETIVEHPGQRGFLKQALLKLGWPAEDFAGYVDGEHHEIALRQDGWQIRKYQELAAEGFWHGGSGVVVRGAQQLSLHLVASQASEQLFYRA